MKLWFETNPADTGNPHGGLGFGLVMLLALNASAGWAEEAAKPAPAKAEPAAAKPAPKAAAEEKTAAKPAAAKPKAKPAGSLGTAECVRTGQRVIAALARDDSGAASQFHNFYMAFKCPPPHLAQAFGCLVNLQTANPGLSNPSPEQISQCWENPDEIPKVTPPKGEGDSGEKH